MGIGRGRPGGNPEFGKSIKRDSAGDEPLERHLQVRLTPSMDEALRSLGDRRLDFVREAIAEKLGRELAAQTTKTETTELVTAGQQPQHNQTNQEGQGEEANPTPGEPDATPKTRRKAGQTQGQKPTKPKSQTRNQKNTVTEN
ncbi:MAG: hypothetical protein ACYTXA_05905 [Nostoc sp.]